MFDKSFVVKLGTFVGMASSVLLSAQIAVAQEPAAAATPPAVTAAETACFSGPAKLSEADVKSFLDQPAALLTDFPSGGLPLSTRVRSLAGSDAATLDPILSLVGSASSTQVAAIGSGLARVARACEKVNPEYAATIQDKVAALGNSALDLAFATALQEIQTAALGAAGAVGGAAGGAAGIGGTGTAGGGVNGTTGTSASTVTQSGTFTAGGGGRSFADTTEDVSPTL
jgi:hypothetical protein